VSLSVRTDKVAPREICTQVLGPSKTEPLLLRNDKVQDVIRRPAGFNESNAPILLSKSTEHGNTYNLVNLLSRNNKFPLRGPRLMPDLSGPRSQNRWPSFVDAQKKTFSKAAPPGVLGTKTPSASPVAMSSWAEGVCRYAPTNS
jgi:hypothetical protein